MKGEAFDFTWNKNLDAYKDWLKEHDGHIPLVKSEGIEHKLASWMLNNQRRYKAGRLEKDRIDKIKSLDARLLTNNNSGIVITSYLSKESKRRYEAIHEVKSFNICDEYKRRLLRAGIIGIDGIVAALMQVYTIREQMQHGDNTALESEVQGLLRALNMDTHKKYPLYTDEILDQVAKRYNKDLEVGTTYLLYRISQDQLDLVLVSGEYNLIGIGDRLKEALKTLLPREQEVMRLKYYGDETHKRLTIQLIAERYGVVKERIAQIDRRALRKLRKAQTFRYIQGKTDRI